MITEDLLNYFIQIDFWELLGLVFGLLAVLFLIKENILTWPLGIIYCILSLYIFWDAKLYQDFFLTIFFLIMNIYGWYEWVRPQPKTASQIKISLTQPNTLFTLLIITLLYIVASGSFFNRYTDASLPFADATTTGISLVAMWMTAKKKLENWILWFVANVLSTIIYAYKGIYFYSVLYLVYIFLAVAGYISWRKKYQLQNQHI